MRRKSSRNTRWVIFARPHQQPGGPPNLFIAWDGTKTESRTLAAKFHTGGEAQAFAEQKGIALDGAVRYVGQFDFSDSDLERPIPN